MLVINSLSLADLGAYAAFLSLQNLACIGINGKYGRYPLSVILVDCLALIQSEIELVGHLRRTLLRTGSARSASGVVNVSSFPVDFDLKVTDLAREFSYLAVSQQVNVRMPTDIQQLGR